jgi:hypothetical protein
MNIMEVLYGVFGLLVSAWLWDILVMFFRPHRKLGPPLLPYRVPFGFDMISKATKVFLHWLWLTAGSKIAQTT